MKIFDTLSQKIHLLDDDPINIYLCGPTVYNHVHIGNVRPLITFDVLNRVLRHKKVKVNMLHNITDIDDKIIKQAVLENLSELVLSNNYANAYFEVMSKLNVIQMENPKVSENIPGIINYIEQLISKKAAYVVDGDVYFRINSIPNYGSLAKINKEELRAGDRVDVDLKKEDPLDFVLWKNTQEGIKWESPWCAGRPGWHTECAYLIRNHFGKQITIHGGGIDLRFPHHENELSQHLALTGEPISKYWMHVGHLNIDNQKMSKSLNNFIYVKQLLEKYDFRVIRWFFYQNHYQSPLNFSNAVLQTAIKDIEKITLTINKARTFLTLNNKTLPSKHEVNHSFLEALEDDLNFANATKVIWEIVSKMNEFTMHKNFEELTFACEQLLWCLDIYGIEPSNIHTKPNIDLIKQWNAKVQNKEYIEADELRTRIQNKKLM
ncbi:cysteine--tRNA ligase [[Mycoplasma] testudinis]|uniref:cysteine--tRNA ligase n=1 Tax=[Mycoplasma] testudinis TaxID=33924 RepID=UPI0004853737|nr:cysteine--tRNA ligase [[Mycoplasma] testudinis]